MKTHLLKIIFLNVLVFACVLTVFAQEKNPSASSRSKKEPVNGSQIQPLDPDKDYVIMTEGETYIRKNGKLMEVKNDRMIEGMRVTPQGKVFKRDGSQCILENGQALTMEGKVIKINESQFLSERMKAMQEQCMAMMEASIETEQNLSMMNEKIRLLNKKTELLNKKMNLVNQQMSKGKKVSKDEQETLNQTMAGLDQELRDTEVKLQQLDEEMTRR